MDDEDILSPEYPIDGLDKDMLPEYEFDYSKAKPNPFAKSEPGLTVVLDSDVAAVFTASEAVN